MLTFNWMVLHLVIVAYANNNYCFANFKYAEGYVSISYYFKYFKYAKG